mmetsp:Transcript_2156/g.4985  ORF Transcript_2156/g.4985 Transcript_2156/m.4985 type:complete len:216 (-) Transcript_2156:1282-1929(-)
MLSLETSQIINVYWTNSCRSSVGKIGEPVNFEQVVSTSKEGYQIEPSIVHHSRIIWRISIRSLSKQIHHLTSGRVFDQLECFAIGNTVGCIKRSKSTIISDRIANCRELIELTFLAEKISIANAYLTARYFRSINTSTTACFFLFAINAIHDEVINRNSVVGELRSDQPVSVGNIHDAECSCFRIRFHDPIVITNIVKNLLLVPTKDPSLLIVTV